MREMQNRTIEDADGKPVEYRIIPFGASQGMRLALEIFALVGPAAGKLLQGALASRGDSSALDADVDLDAVVREAAHALVGSDTTSLMRRLLANTTRAGQSLDNLAVFDVSYQGNFGELIDALVAVIEVNRFVDFFVRPGRRLLKAVPV